MLTEVQTEEGAVKLLENDRIEKEKKNWKSADRIEVNKNNNTNEHLLSIDNKTMSKRKC